MVKFGMTILRPALPEGDVYEIERITYEGPRTMSVTWWKHRANGSRWYAVACVNVHPRWWRVAFLLCYLKGLERLRSDRVQERKSKRANHRFKLASRS